MATIFADILDENKRVLVPQVTVHTEDGGHGSFTVRGDTADLLDDPSRRYYLHRHNEEPAQITIKSIKPVFGSQADTVHFKLRWLDTWKP